MVSGLCRPGRYIHRLRDQKRNRSPGTRRPSSRIYQDRDGWLDPFVLNQSARHVGWPKGGIGGKHLGTRAKALLGAQDHLLRRTNFRLTDRCGCFDTKLITVNQALLPRSQHRIRLLQSASIESAINNYSKDGLFNSICPEWTSGTPLSKERRNLPIHGARFKKKPRRVCPARLMQTLPFQAVARQVRRPVRRPYRPWRHRPLRPVSSWRRGGRARPVPG